MSEKKGGNAVADMLQSRAGLAAILMALASFFLVNPVPLSTERIPA